MQSIVFIKISEKIFQIKFQSKLHPVENKQRHTQVYLFGIDVKFKGVGSRPSAIIRKNYH